MNKTHTLTCVYIDMRLWEGRSKLTKDDEDWMGVKKLPADIVNVGSKRIFPAKPLRTFTALRKQAERLCEDHGSRFLNGFLIPPGKLDALASKLDALQAKFYSTLDEMIKNYDVLLSEYLNEHVALTSFIQKSVITSDQARKRFWFNRVFFDVTVPENMEETSQLDIALQGLAGQVLHELSVEAGELVKMTLKPNKEMARQTTRRMLAKMQDKLLGFGFMDTRLAAITAKLEAVLDSLPLTGMIVGKDYVNLKRTFEVLADDTKSCNPANYPVCTPRFKRPADSKKQPALELGKGFDNSIL